MTADIHRFFEDQPINNDIRAVVFVNPTGFASVDSIPPAITIVNSSLYEIAGMIGSSILVQVCQKVNVMKTNNKLNNKLNKGRFSLKDKWLIKGAIIEGISDSKIAEMINRSIFSVQAYIQSIEIEDLVETYKHNIKKIQNRNNVQSRENVVNSDRIKELEDKELLKEMGLITKVHNRNDQMNWVNAPRSY